MIRRVHDPDGAYLTQMLLPPIAWQVVPSGQAGDEGLQGTAQNGIAHFFWLPPRSMQTNPSEHSLSAVQALAPGINAGPHMPPT